MLNSVSGETFHPKYPSPLKEPEVVKFGYTQPENLTMQQAAACVAAASVIAAVATRPISNLHRFAFIGDLPGHNVGVGSGLGKRRHVLDILFGTSWWKHANGRKEMDPALIAGASFAAVFGSYWFAYHSLLHGTDSRIFNEPAVKAVQYNTKVVLSAAVEGGETSSEISIPQTAAELSKKVLEKKVYDPTFAGCGGQGKERATIEREAAERGERMLKELQAQLGPDAVSLITEEEGREGTIMNTGTKGFKEHGPDDGWGKRLLRWVGLGSARKHPLHLNAATKREDVPLNTSDVHADNREATAPVSWRDRLPSASDLASTTGAVSQSQHELEMRLQAADPASRAVYSGTLVASSSWRTAGYMLPDFGIYANWPLNGFLAGAAAGFTLTALRHPYDVLAATAEHPGPGGRVFAGPWDVFQTMLRERPAMLKGIYRGAHVSLMASSIQFSLMFGIYNTFKYDVAVGGSDLQMYALCHLCSFTGYTMQYPIHSLKQTLDAVNRDLASRSTSGGSGCQTRITMWAHFKDIKRRNGITKVYDGFFKFKPFFLTMPAAFALFAFDKSTRRMQERNYPHTIKKNASGQSMFKTTTR